MFKKPKKIVPPTAPSIEEVLSDLETFQVDDESRSRKTVGLITNPTEDWWTAFEESMEDLKCLEMVYSEIGDMETKLKSLRNEIDTGTKLLKDEVDKQRQLVDEAIQLCS